MLSCYGIHSIKKAKILIHEKTFKILKINNSKDYRELLQRHNVINLDNKFTKLSSIKTIKNNPEYNIFKIILKRFFHRQIIRSASLLGYKVLDLLRINFAKVFIGNLKARDWNLSYKNKF